MDVEEWLALLERAARERVARTPAPPADLLDRVLASLERAGAFTATAPSSGAGRP